MPWVLHRQHCLQHPVLLRCFPLGGGTGWGWVGWGWVGGGWMLSRDGEVEEVQCPISSIESTVCKTESCSGLFYSWG